MSKTSKKPQVGQTLYAYSSIWRGPRPAIVVNAFDAAGVANVSVILDQANDMGLPAMLSDPSVDVFDEAVGAMDHVSSGGSKRGACFGTYSVACSIEA